MVLNSLIKAEEALREIGKLEDSDIDLFDSEDEIEEEVERMSISQSNFVIKERSGIENPWRTIYGTL